MARSLEMSPTMAISIGDCAMSFSSHACAAGKVILSICSGVTGCMRGSLSGYGNADATRAPKPPGVFMDSSMNCLDMVLYCVNAASSILGCVSNRYASWKPVSSSSGLPEILSEIAPGVPPPPPPRPPRPPRPPPPPPPPPPRTFTFLPVISSRMSVELKFLVAGLPHASCAACVIPRLSAVSNKSPPISVMLTVTSFLR